MDPGCNHYRLEYRQNQSEVCTSRLTLNKHELENDFDLYNNQIK